MSLFQKQPVFEHGDIFERKATEPFDFDLHKHDTTSEMLLIVEGEGTFEIGGSTYHVGPGTLLFYHQGVWHKELSTKYPFRAIFISFKNLEIRDLPPGFFLDSQAPPVIPLLNLFPVVRALMEECLKIYREKEPEYPILINGLLRFLFGKLAKFVYYDKSEETPVKSSKEVVLAAKLYMEQNYRSPLTLETLAKVTLVNKFHLAHLFKQETGISPIRFLTTYRMEVAKHYLATTSYSIDKICELVGYKSEPSFYNIFMKVTGFTPRQYRIQQEHR